MKQRVIIGIVVFTILVVLPSSHFVNLLLNFFLAGVLPGTQVRLPFWVMMAAYSLVAAAIIARHVEKILIARHHRQIANVQQERPALPRRRYNQATN